MVHGVYCRYSSPAYLCAALRACDDARAAQGILTHNKNKTRPLSPLYSFVYYSYSPHDWYPWPHQSRCKSSHFLLFNLSFLSIYHLLHCMPAISILYCLHHPSIIRYAFNYTIILLMICCRSITSILHAHFYITVSVSFLP